MWVVIAVSYFGQTIGWRVRLRKIKYSIKKKKWLKSHIQPLEMQVFSVMGIRFVDYPIEI